MNACHHIPLSRQQTMLGAHTVYSLVQTIRARSSGWSIPTACDHSMAAGNGPSPLPPPILRWAGLAAARQSTGSTNPRRAERRAPSEEDGAETDERACSCFKNTGKVSLKTEHICLLVCLFVCLFVFLAHSPEDLVAQSVLQEDLPGGEGSGGQLVGLPLGERGPQLGGVEHRIAGDHGEKVVL